MENARLELKTLNPLRQGRKLFLWGIPRESRKTTILRRFRFDFSPFDIFNLLKV